MRKTILLRAVLLVVAAGAIAAACSAGGGDALTTPGGGVGGSGEAGGDQGGAAGSAANGAGGGILFDSGTIEETGPGAGFITNPKTCAESAQSRSYVGCDYWPTVTANNVWSIFDFAVVVANAGKEDAQVTVTGPNGTNTQEVVPPNSLKTIYLPWVPALKGPEADTCGSATPMTASVMAAAGAFHLVSSIPVTVYQFNALEYKGQGGPPGKNWGSCPGNKMCPQTFSAVGCFSFSNDASLLLPSTAWTQNYRVIGSAGWEVQGQAIMPSYMVVTASQDGTEVELKTTGKVLAGGGLSAMSKGQSGKVTLNAGDVIEIVGGNTAGDDFSGSLISASKPVQVITGMPCVNKPSDKGACDHVEESVFPAETLGKAYVVTLPANAKGAKVPGQMVKIVGNVDGTQLTFDPPVKIGASATINAGQVIDLGQVVQDFKVSGDKEFIVATWMLGAEVVDPGVLEEAKGDPSQSLATAIEQYRDSYIFLAPQDYDVNFVNIIAEPGTNVVLDGNPVDNGAFSPVGGSGMNVARVKLAPTGSHQLDANKAVGIQVYGYGSYTTYQYPGGLNLRTIAAPPK